MKRVRNPINNNSRLADTIKTGQVILGRVWQWLAGEKFSFKRLFIRGGGVAVGLLIIYALFLWITLPSINDPRSFLASQSSVITDRNGVELYRLHGEEDRTYIEAEQIPDTIRQAIIAIEDERFYDRGCLDVRAILRAVVGLGKSGGASTLTRQLARNALGLQQDRIINRKLKELILGCQLEAKFSKDELLNLYLNWIPFGQNAYGIEQAAQTYFGKSASGLTLAQSVVLASLPQRPSYLSPYGRHVYTQVSDEVTQAVIAGSITSPNKIDQEEIRIGLLGANIGSGAAVVYLGGRSDQVLQNMFEQELITSEERLNALQDLQSVEFQPSRENIRAPYFVIWIREQINELLAAEEEADLLERGGIRIETTLDWDLQQAAEYAVEFHKEDILNRFGAYNGALLSVDRETREILAYVGNMDFEDEEHEGKIDMVQVPRQPGSSFKPFVYAAAFERGYNPSTVIYDVPTKIGSNEPQNFDGKFTGPLTIRHALGASRNIPAAKAYFLGGQEDAILALVNNLGAPTPHVKRTELAKERPDGFDYGWPLALGAAETPLYEMVQAYSTFADGGYYQPLTSIRQITDKRGNILYKSDSEEERDKVLDERIAFLITDILSDENARPEEYWKTQLTVPGYQTAGKTGTSNKCLERDEDGTKTGTKDTCLLRKPDNAWLIGYTPDLVTGVWVGNANSTAMFAEGGGLNTASPIWRDYMIKAHRLQGGSQTKFEDPKGVIRTQISLLSGQLPTECTPNELRSFDVFLQENAPTAGDPACAQLTIDKVTRLLASDTCPADAQEEGSFIVAKSLLPDRWPSWEEGVQEWVAEQMEMWYAAPDHSGATIILPIAPTEVCDISLTPGRLDKPTVRVLYPQENGTATYPAFKPKLDVEVGSKIREIEYKVDGKRVAKFTESPFIQALRLPRSIDQAGRHTFQVIMIDEYYNKASATVNFRFGEDTAGPSVRLTSPVQGLSVRQGASITLQAEADDTDGGVKYVEFYLDDVLLSTKPKAPYKMEYTLDVEPGLHVIRAEAEDFAKNRIGDEVEIIVAE